MQIANSYYDLGGDFYREQEPERVLEPELVAFNEKLAQELGLDGDERYFTEVFSGNKLILGSKPIALAYAGHQFGHFVPQLGDGRAVLLGEVKGEDGVSYDLQLKGAGRTFFSRNGDGKCPLDAAIREYLVSEAMHFLKIPTTRSLAIVKSKDFVQRQGLVPASVITRVAKGHVRVGTFEYFAYRGDFANLRILADYVISRFFPKCGGVENLLQAVMKSQAELVASWMSVGFIHGVMNTDNVCISGETLDYGPCAFMDEYRSDQVFSYIDKRGRYSFSNQKHIILWNLAKFAGAISPLIDIDRAEAEINEFPELFDQIYYQKMAQKIGIFDFDDDKALIDGFLDILEAKNIDFTNGFRVLSKVLRGEGNFYDDGDKWRIWQEKWRQRLKKQGLSFKEIAKKMDEVNPVLIPRNHIVAEVIEKAVFHNDYSEFTRLLEAIRDPFVKKEDFVEYYRPPKENERVVNTFCGT